jgi:predicted RNA binding protein YcfA (HicA-like mRNA interferase family)
MFIVFPLRVDVFVRCEFVTVRRVIRLIEADGWVQVRQKGSHRHFKHPTKVGLVKSRETSDENCHPRPCEA